MDCLYRECAIGSSSGTEFTAPELISHKSKRANKASIRNYLLGFGELFSRNGWLVFIFSKWVTCQNTVSAYQKAFMNTEKIKKAELSTINEILFPCKGTSATHSRGCGEVWIRVFPTSRPSQPQFGDAYKEAISKDLPAGVASLLSWEFFVLFYNIPQTLGILHPISIHFLTS